MYIIWGGGYCGGAGGRRRVGECTKDHTALGEGRGYEVIETNDLVSGTWSLLDWTEVGRGCSQEVYIPGIILRSLILRALPIGIRPMFYGILPIWISMI